MEAGVYYYKIKLSIKTMDPAFNWRGVSFAGGVRFKHTAILTRDD